MYPSMLDCLNFLENLGSGGRTCVWGEILKAILQFDIQNYSSRLLIYAFSTFLRHMTSLWRQSVEFDLASQNFQFQAASLKGPYT